MSVTTYQVTIQDRVLTVTLRREENSLFARVGDGQEWPVRLEALQPPLCALTLGDRRVELLGQRTAGGARIALDGLAFEVAVQDELHARLAKLADSTQAGQGRRELKAPMPGLVVKVLCQAGDAIERGQPLVVLQAMKMENELALPQAGTVQSVAVEPGQTVEHGQLLLVVE